MLEYSGGFSETFSGFNTITVSQENIDSQGVMTLGVEDFGSYILKRFNHSPII